MRTHRRAGCFGKMPTDFTDHRTAEETLEKWKMLKDDNEESGHPRYDNPKRKSNTGEISICKAGNISR